MVRLTGDLSKSRSAKVMRRFLRDIAEGRVLGDTPKPTDPAMATDIR